VVPAVATGSPAADPAIAQAYAQPHAESVLPERSAYGPVPVYGRSVESILAAVAAERGAGGASQGLEGLGTLGAGASDAEDALDLVYNQLPRWAARGDSHVFDWSGATNYTALHLEARGVSVWLSNDRDQ